MSDEFEKLQQDSAYRTNTRNFPLLVLICYILYSIKEYDYIIPLVNDIKDADIYGLKFLTYWQMKRYDYMQKTYEEIKQFAEDSSLTQLLDAILMLCTGNTKDLVANLNSVMQRYDKSIKLYNLVGMAMLSKGQTEKTVKIYAKLVDDLGLKDPVKCKKFVGNADVIDLLHNYLLALRWSEDASSPQIVDAEKILSAVDAVDKSAALQEFEAKFEEAHKKVFT